MLGWFQRKKKNTAIARAHYRKENVGNDASALPSAQLDGLENNFGAKNKKANKAAFFSTKKPKKPKQTKTAAGGKPANVEFIRPDVPAQAGSGLLKKAKSE